MFLKKNFKKNTTLPFAFSFFNDFLFFYSFYITYFTLHGFTGQKLALLLIIMNASKMLADIPIGIISDVISRRNVLLLGLLFRSIFCVLCLTSNSFYNFALASIFIGIGNSCLWTQTWNYFYDYLKEKKQEQHFSVFMGKFYAFSNIAIACAGFTGSHIFSIVGFKGIFIGSICSLFLAFLITMQLPNYKPKTTIKTAKNIKVSSPIYFFTLLQQLIKKPRIMRLLLLTILMDAMFIVFIDMNTAVMNYAKNKAEDISQVVGLVAFIRVFSNYFSGRTERFMSFKRMHSFLLVLMAVSVALSFYNSNWLVIFISCYLCLYPFFDTSIKTKIEHKLDSNTRATVLSLASLCVSIATIVLNAVIGVLAEENGYFVAPIFVFLIAIIILFVVRNIMSFYRVDAGTRKIVKKIVKKKKARI